MRNRSVRPARRVRIGRAASIFAACAVTACTSGERQADAAGEVLVIRGGWLFDGTGEEAVPNRGIVIHDSVFAEVNVEVSEAALEGARVIELTDDEFIIPGMFDLHAHYAVDLLGEGRVDEDRVYPALFLGNGVTSTFPAGEVQPERMRELRFRIERGEQVGPRVFNSGPYFGSAREDWNDATTAEEIAAEVDYWVSQGARGFKAKGIEARHLEPLIESAHRHGLTVTGHLGSGWRGSVNPREAILMGIDRIEHFAGGDAVTPDRSAYASLVEMTPDMPEFREIVELFIARGVNYDATLSAYGYYGRRDPEVYTYFANEMDYLTPYARELVESRLPRRVNEQFERIYWVKRGLVKKFYDLGGGDLLTLGTDHPSWGEYLSGFSVHRELHAFVLSGIPAAAALRIATINGARALRVDDRLGTIERGKLADLVILGGDPLEDITNTRHVRTVIRHGKDYDAPEVLRSVLGQLGPNSQEDVPAW